MAWRVSVKIIQVAVVVSILDVHHLVLSFIICTPSIMPLDIIEQETSWEAAPILGIALLTVIRSPMNSSILEDTGADGSSRRFSAIAKGGIGVCVIGLSLL